MATAFTLALWALPVATLMILAEDYRQKKKRIRYNSGNTLKFCFLSLISAPFVGCGALTLTSSYRLSADPWPASYSIPVTLTFMFMFMFIVFYFTHARQEEAQ